MYASIATAYVCQQADVSHHYDCTGEGIVLEVDRFDPGRLPKGKDSIIPTALIPGDIAIPCQVCGNHPCC